MTLQSSRKTHLASSSNLHAVFCCAERSANRVLQGCRRYRSDRIANTVSAEDCLWLFALAIAPGIFTKETSSLRFNANRYSEKSVRTAQSCVHSHYIFTVHDLQYFNFPLTTSKTAIAGKHRVSLSALTLK